MDVSGWGSCLERPAACWLDRWLFLLSNGVPTESWSHYGLASMVHLMLAVSQDGAVALLERPTACWPDRWLFLLSNGVPTESWSHYGLASMVHLMLAGVSGRGSCLERPTTCCHNRWSILPSNGVPMEPWSQCGLASVVHLVLAGGSGRYDGTSPITWQGRWSALLRHKGLESWCWYGLASTVHPCWWMAQDGAVALRGPLHAATTDGRFLQATESPWSRGVSVAWHPSCTLWWQVAQGGAVIMGHPPYAGKEDGQFFWSTKAPGVLEWSILTSNGVPMESWSQCGLASIVHLVVAGGSGRGSYHGTSAIRWQGRWSVLLVHKGPRSPGMVDSSTQRSPHGAVESVCPGIHGAPHASRWLRTHSYDGTSPITWQGRWSALLRHKGLESWCWYGLASTVHPCWWMAQDGAVALRGPLHAATTDVRFLQATESPWSRGVSVAWHPSCTLWWQVAQGDLRLTIAKTTFGADCGWFSARGSYHGTSAIRWQGRWSVLPVHKGPQSPGVSMAWPPWCTPAGGWLRMGLCPGETCHVLPQQMVDSSKQQSPHGVMESVCPGIHGAPRASRWLRTGQLSWDIPHILARNVVHSSEPQRPPESWSHYGLASMVHPC
uniref:uncharacterized protein LOC100894745 isoform X15 n=1 Tax=Callithrix jacchus TaxID=9483 RepID=UPI0023DCEC88|nr:uncharacterized protein LOC100894745 isoform X15 [Callithrix jacchus]